MEIISRPFLWKLILKLTWSWKFAPKITKRLAEAARHDVAESTEVWMKQSDEGCVSFFARLRRRGDHTTLWYSARICRQKSTYSSSQFSAITSKDSCQQVLARCQREPNRTFTYDVFAPLLCIFYIGRFLRRTFTTQQCSLQVLLLYSLLWKYGRGLPCYMLFNTLRPKYQERKATFLIHHLYSFIIHHKYIAK